MSQNKFEYKVTPTTCPYCGVGCGVDVTSVDNKVVEVSGNETHPANFGKLCVKGSNLHQTTGLEGRLLYPHINNEPVDWSQATDYVAKAFSDTIAQYGPDSVAFYVSGQILTEDYYVANKLMKGYIGSGNIDTNSRLCMSSAVAGYKRAFGSDTVPCNYEDLEQTDLLVMVGSNAAWTHPVLFQRIEAAKANNPNFKIIVIDPRKTATAQIADLYLPVRAGSDVALFNGLLNYLIAENKIDQQYIDQHCEGWSQTLDIVESYTLSETAKVCQISEPELTAFFSTFANSPKVITFYSQGVNQSSRGTDNCNAIINCHLATGQIGKPGAGPFSITGQPNAMGGREVGGLANMLAAHMNIENPDHRDIVQEFWQSPVIAQESGFKAVEMFQKIKSGDIKAVWIMATNPMVSLPNRNEIQKALEACPLVVVSDCMATNDTLPFAHVTLPATTWAEKDGTVTNSERRISRQKGILTPPGEAKHDWQALSEVGQKMGWHDAFNFQSPVEVFREHAALSGYKNATDGQPIRDFDISALKDISEIDYNRFAPIQWPVNQANPNGCERMFEDGLFYTASRKAQFIAVKHQLPKQPKSDAYPMILNSGRVRDHWHTMTRTAKSANLAKHLKEPFVSIHPKDAAKQQIQQGQLVKVGSPYGEVLLPAQFDSGLTQNNLFVPIHWNQTTAPTANVSKCFGSFYDPVSGQPESKFAYVAVEPVNHNQYIQCFSREAFNPDTLYWASATIPSGFEYACINESKVDMPIFWAKATSQIEGDWSYFENSQSGLRTVLCIRDQVLQFAGFFSGYKPEINAEWIESLFTSEAITAEQINKVLRVDIDTDYLNGKTICSCYKIGENQIIEAIVEEGDTTVEQLGKRLKCGTNCGSCKSELRGLIQQNNPEKVVETRIPVVSL